MKKAPVKSKDVAGKLIDLLNSLPVSKWGIANIEGLHPVAEKYPRAISLVKAYSPDFEEYDEKKFNDLFLKNLAELDRAKEELKHFLDNERVKYQIISDEHVDELSSTFSHKLAATRAGLGWVGKNSLLVTEEYGPRVLLATILVDLDLPYGEPMNESLCKDCRACVDACPHGFIKNIEWYPGIERDMLFDAFACSSKRGDESDEKTDWTRNACGLCLLSCPKGKA